MDNNTISSLIETIEIVSESIYRNQNVTINQIGLVKSKESQTCIVDIMDNEIECYLTDSMKNLIYEQDVVLVSFIPKTKQRFIIGAISRNGEISNIHIYDTTTDTIISTSLSLIDENGLVKNVSLEIYNDAIK